MVSSSLFLLHDLFELRGETRYRFVGLVYFLAIKNMCNIISLKPPEDDMRFAVRRDL